MTPDSRSTPPLRGPAPPTPWPPSGCQATRHPTGVQAFVFVFSLNTWWGKARWATRRVVHGAAQVFAVGNRRTEGHPHPCGVDGAVIHRSAQRYYRNSIGSELQAIQGERHDPPESQHWRGFQGFPVLQDGSVYAHFRERLCVDNPQSRERLCAKPGALMRGQDWLFTASWGQGCGRGLDLA
jgi:hypothetical protein